MQIKYGFFLKTPLFQKKEEWRNLLKNSEKGNILIKKLHKHLIDHDYKEDQLPNFDELTKDWSAIDFLSELMEETDCLTFSEGLFKSHYGSEFELLEVLVENPVYDSTVFDMTKYLFFAKYTPSDFIENSSVDKFKKLDLYWMNSIDDHSSSKYDYDSDEMPEDYLIMQAFKNNSLFKDDSTSIGFYIIDKIL